MLSVGWHGPRGVRTGSKACVDNGSVLKQLRLDYVQIHPKYHGVFKNSDTHLCNGWNSLVLMNGAPPVIICTGIAWLPVCAALHLCTLKVNDDKPSPAAERALKVLGPAGCFLCLLDSTLPAPDLNLGGRKFSTYFADSTDYTGLVTIV